VGLKVWRLFLWFKRTLPRDGLGGSSGMSLERRMLATAGVVMEQAERGICPVAFVALCLSRRLSRWWISSLMRQRDFVPNP